MTALAFHIDRVKKIPLSNQIYSAVRDAIETGQIPAHTKLPSWRDLAAQLGVSRGTVRLAYERLIDEQLAVGLGAAGTRVTERPPSSRSVSTPESSPMPALFRDFSTAPKVFQMGVPAQDAFPYPLWSRLSIKASRDASTAPVGYPDPRGEAELRGEVAAYLSIARGLQCSPSQVFITGGFAGALGLVTRGLRLEGQTAWVEDPGFPLTRTALTLAGLNVAAIPVDAEGLDVAAGLRLAGNAALAVVTPGQQAPLGMTMSLARRLQLLEWARSTGAWIIEDDYLGELQLNGRAAPALASLAQDERVLHIGTFSKTISPALRLGFLVVPPALVQPFGDLATCLAPAPAAAIQRTVANFMHEGHYLRHLRRMKRLYAARRAALLRCLEEEASDALTVQMTAGMAVVTQLTGPRSDVEIAQKARVFGLSPSPLSPWSVRAPQAQGLLLGVTNINEQHLAADCRQLAALVRSG